MTGRDSDKQVLAYELPAHDAVRQQYAIYMVLAKKGMCEGTIEAGLFT
jgi:hypothetical protein